MLASKFNLHKHLTALILIMVLGACAQPAHKNTLPWNTSINYTTINIVAPNQYLIDGLYFNTGSLQHWLKQRQRAGLLMPLLLESPDEWNLIARRNYFEMATIAESAEKLGFEVYFSRAGFIHNKTSSKDLLALADNQNTPDDTIMH